MRGLSGDALVVAHKRHAHELAPRHLVEHEHGLETRGHAIGGVRIEDTLVVESKESRVLTELARELVVVG